MKTKLRYWCALITLVFLCLPVTALAADNPVGVSYRGHIQDRGDYPADGSWIDSPTIIGTTGESKRIEGFEIKHTGDVPAYLPNGLELRYNVHVQNRGWLYDEDDSSDWPKDGAYAGTRGDSLRIEAVKLVLTDVDGQAVSGYSVQYRGHVQNVGDLPKDTSQWLADGAQLGTVGSSLRLEALLVEVVKTAVDPPEPAEPQVYDKAGSYGPEQGSETIAGDVTVAADGVTLQNLVIEGNLTISEAVGNGTVTLNNVTVKGDTRVRGGGVNSIHINGGQYSRIIMEKTASGAVRIVATGVDGLAVVIAEDAAGETIILEGTFASVTVNASNMTVTTQGNTTTIGTLTVGAEAAGTTLNLASGTTVADLVLDAKTAVKGPGTATKAAVNADGVVFETAPGAYTVTPGLVIPPVFPNPGGGGGGTVNVPVSGVSLDLTSLSLKKNATATLTATVAPVAATNKAVTWTSTDNTIATVASDGTVTALAEGLATITVTTQDGGKWATCDVTVKDLNPAIGLTVPFHGDTPDLAITETNQYLGTVIWREQGGSTDLAATAHFDGAKTYQATITLSLKGFYSPADIDIDYFMVSGATTSTTAGSLTITATFAPVNQYRIDPAGLITAYSGPGGAVVIPDTIATPGGAIAVTGIGEYTFNGRGLTSITLPETVTSIGFAAFENNSLTALVIPDQVTTIGHYAFYNNSTLTTLILPGQLTINNLAFFEDPITRIAIGDGANIVSQPGTMGDFCAYFTDYYNNATAGKPARTAGNYVFTGGVWQIDNGLTFSTTGDAITGYDPTRGPYIFIPAKKGLTPITFIVDNAFNNDPPKTKLKTVTFASDSQLLVIGNGSFQHNGLEQVVLPNTVRDICTVAFADNQITSLVILGTTSSLTIAGGAFSSTGTGNPITRITIPAGVTIMENSGPGSSTMGLYGANFKAAYEDSVNGGAGIYNYDSVSASWIREPIAVGVTRPFYGDMPVTSITADARFAGIVGWQETDGSLMPMRFNGAKSYTATILLTATGDYQFNPVAAFAIEGATVTADIALDCKTATITAVFAPVDQYRIDNTGQITAYSGPGGAVVIPDTIGTTTVTKIGYGAFSSRGLTAITLPQKLTSIGLSAFADNNLTALVIPAAVIAIGQEAFALNMNLTTVTLPGDLYVGQDAFYDDPITSITIGANVNIDTMGVAMGFYGDTFVNYYNSAIAGNPAKAAGYYRYTGVWKID